MVLQMSCATTTARDADGVARSRPAAAETLAGSVGTAGTKAEVAAAPKTGTSAPTSRGGRARARPPGACRRRRSAAQLHGHDCKSCEDQS